MSSVDYHSDEKQDVHSTIPQKTQPTVIHPTDRTRTRQKEQQQPLRTEQPPQRQVIRPGEDEQQRPVSILDNTVFKQIFDARNGVGFNMDFDLNTKVAPEVKQTRSYYHDRSLSDKYDSHMEGPATLSLPSFTSVARSKGNILEDGTLLKEFQTAANLISTMVEPVYRAPIIGEIGSHLTPFVLDNLDHDINTSYYSNSDVHFVPSTFSWRQTRKTPTHATREHAIDDGHPGKDFDIDRYYYLREHGGKIPYLVGNSTVLGAIAPLFFGKNTTSDFTNINPSTSHHVDYHNRNNDYHEVNYDQPSVPTVSLIQGQNLAHTAQHPSTSSPITQTFPINSQIFTNKPATMRNIVITRGSGNLPHLLNENELYKRQQLQANQYGHEEHIQRPDSAGLYAIRLSPDFTDKPTIRITTPFSGSTNYTLDNVDNTPLPPHVVSRIAKNIAIERNRHAADLEYSNTRRLDKELLESLNVSVAEVAREQLQKQYDSIYSTAKGESELRLKDLERVIDAKAEEGKIAHDAKQRAIDAALLDYEAQLKAAKDRYNASVKKEKEEHESVQRALSQQQKDAELQLKMHDENLRRCEHELSLRRQEYRENKNFVGSPQEITNLENQRISELRALREDADRKLQDIKLREEHAIEDHKRKMVQYKSSLDEHSKLYENRKRELSDLEKQRQQISAASKERIDQLTSEIQHIKAQREKEFMEQSRQLQQEINQHQAQLSNLEKEYQSQNQDLIKKQNEIKNNINMLKTEREHLIETINRDVEKERRAYEDKKRRLHDSLADAEKHLQKAKENYEQVDRISNERILQARRQLNQIELELCGEVVDVVERRVPIEKEITTIEEKRVLVPSYQTHYDTVITTTNSKGEVTQKVLHGHHPDPSVQKQIDEAKKALHEQEKKDDKGIIQTIKDTFTANAKGRAKKVDHSFHFTHSLASRYGGGDLLSNSLLDSETDEELDDYGHNYGSLIDTDTDEEY